MEELNELLTAYLSPTASTDVTQQLNAFVKQPVAPPLLVQILFQHPDAKKKQLAALLLRKQIYGIWKRDDASFKNEIKPLLLDRIVKETDAATRKEIANLIAAIASMCFADWKEALYSVVSTIFHSSVAEDRATAIRLLNGILDFVDDEEIPAQVSAELLYNALLDTDTQVKLLALNGVKSIILLNKEAHDFKGLRALLRPVISVLQEGVSTGHNEKMQSGMEVLDEMIENSDVLESSDIPDLVRFMLIIAKQQGLDTGLRDQALNFISSAARSKPKVLSKPDLLSEVLAVLLSMGAEPEEEEETEMGEDEDTITPHIAACKAVDFLALHLPYSRVYKAVSEKLAPFIHSANPHERKAALVFIGIMSEGCKAVMRNKLDQLLPYIFSAFEDSALVVRGAAATCLSQFAEFLQPEILLYHERAMHCLINQIKLNSPRVQEKCLGALESFCENMDKNEMQCYLKELMPFLIAVLKDAKNDTVRASCLGAIAAVAQSSKEMFLEYADELLNLLKEPLKMNFEDSKIQSLQAKSIGVVGNVAKALTIEEFAPYRPTMTQLILEKMEGSHFEIREQGFIYFFNLAEVMKEQFAEYVDPVIEHIFTTLLPVDEKLFAKYGIKDNSLGEMELFEEAVSEGPDFHQGLDDAVEVQAAALCLRELWEVCPKQCLPHYQRTETVLHAINCDVHSDVTKQSGYLMKEVLKALEGDALKATKKLSKPNLDIWENEFWPMMLELLQETAAKETVSDNCSALGTMCEEFGSEIIAPHVEEVVNLLTLLFQFRHTCQQHEDLDQDEESRNEEENLFEGVCDLIVGMAKSFGPSFVEVYKAFHNVLLEMATHKKSLAYSAIGLGCVAEVFRAMGPTSQPFVENFVYSMLRGVQQTEDLYLRRCAAYCGGVFVETQAETMLKLNVLPSFIQAIHPIFTSRDNLNENEHAVLDNAASAIGRILMHVPADKLPVEQLITLFLSALPLEEDFYENESVFKTLLFLFREPHYQPFVQSNMLHYLRVSILHICLPKEYAADPELVTELTQYVKHLLKQFGTSHPLVTELYDSLKEETMASMWVRDTMQSIA